MHTTVLMVLLISPGELRQSDRQASQFSVKTPGDDCYRARLVDWVPSDRAIC